MFLKQKTNRFYNPSPSHDKIRPAILQWVRKLTKTLEYSEKTYYTAVAILDAIFSKCEVDSSEQKVICFVSLYLSSKMNESEAKIPTISDILVKFKGQITKEQFLNTEIIIFKNILGFKVDIVTPYCFLN